MCATHFGASLMGTSLHIRRNDASSTFCGAPHHHSRARCRDTPSVHCCLHARRDTAVQSAVRHTCLRFSSSGDILQGGLFIPRRSAPSSRGRKVITCSFFGVGAPEALLVGVVALVVFGPKGLAEAVKSLGKTLRAFQPTIREIASVSSDLRNSLEEQIGLDEIRQELRSSVVPEPRPRPTTQTGEGTNSSDTDESSSSGKTLEDLVAETDEDIERKRAAAAAAAWGGQPPKPPADVDSTPKFDERAEQPRPGGPSAPKLEGLSLKELEEELARRKAANKSA